MLALRHLFIVVQVAGAGLFAGCASTGPDTPPDGSGGNVMDEGVCGPEVQPLLILGQGTGSGFVPLEPGDDLPLEFGSQAGMEAPLSVRGEGIDPALVGDILVQLLVEEDPIGRVDETGDELVCDAEGVQVDTPLLIDVTQHPTVVSVAQLASREALATATFESDGETLEASVSVVLQP